MSGHRLMRPWWLVVLACLVAVPAGRARLEGQDARAMTDAPPAIPPEQQALNAASRITSVSDRLAALEKVRADFPASPLLNTVDEQVLSTVLLTQDPVDSANAVLDRMLARIPANATAGARFEALVDPVTQLVVRKVLLDRAEALLTSSVAALSAETSAESRAQARYLLGRIYAVRGNMTRAEAEYQAAAPHWPAALTSLVTLYVDRGETAKAEAFLLNVVTTTPVNPNALSSLTNFYRATPEKAEAVLRDAVGRDPLLPSGLLALARLEHQRGDETGALDHFMKAAALVYLRGPDGETMRALYARLHGTTDGLEADINRRFSALPKPLAPPAYVPTGARTDRLVVVELFTGSACPPCVAADLALDAALERYPADAVVPLVYHQHIPGPDPMTTSAGNARRQYYQVDGVPTLQVDGMMVSDPATGDNFGGGGRARAATVYDRYAGLIDHALETAPDGAVAVRATIVGDTVTVTADVSKLPAHAADLRLNIVLAERELLFGGENGMRHHPMVVRGIAGDNGTGVPLTRTGTFQQVFDLAAIRTDITRGLATDIARRRSGGGSSDPFAAEDRPMTTIDPGRLIAVAFIQASNRAILQAARADVRVATGK